MYSTCKRGGQAEGAEQEGSKPSLGVLRAAAVDFIPPVLPPGSL